VHGHSNLKNKIIIIIIINIIIITQTNYNAEELADNK